MHVSSLQSPLSITQRSLAESGEICAICLNDIRAEEGNVYIINSCMHKFHEDCIRRWKMEQATCPLCREALSEEEGATEVLEQSSPTNIVTNILRLLPAENERPLSDREKITNIVLSPFGIVYIVMVIPLILVLEILYASLSSPVFFLLHLADICFDNSSGICYRLNDSVHFMFLCIMLLPYAVLVFIGQICMLMEISTTFCFNVFICKKRWRDAFPNIIRRIILETVECWF